MSIFLHRRELLIGTALTVALWPVRPLLAQPARRGAPAGPVAPKRPVTITRHGQARTDDYAWMRDPNWQAVIDDPARLAPEIRAHIDAENAYTNHVLLEPTQSLRDRLFAELKARLKPDDSTVPARDGPFDYFTRYRAGGQYPLVVRRPVAGGESEETVLIDGDREASGEPFWRLQNWVQSPDHKTLAYFVDYEGGNKGTLRFRDMTSGTDRPYRIEGCSEMLVWAPDSASCYYTRLDASFRTTRVMRHVLGSDPVDDTLVYEEKDPAFQMSIARSASGAWLVILREESDSTDALVMALARPLARPRRFTPYRRGVKYYPEHHDGHFYVLTNAGGAVDFKIARTPVGATSARHWRDVVPHRPGVFLTDMILTAGHMVRREMNDALPRLVVRDMTSGAEHDLAFAEEAYELTMVEGHEWRTTQLRFTYSSPSTPTETWDYDMAARTRQLRKRQEIPSGHRPADYVVRRIVARAADGAAIPVTILHHRSTPIDASAPALLYGYGAYGHSEPASFSTARLPLVDRGLVYAIAHIRGGQERGWQWYRDGKLDRKQNSFSDFARVAEALVEQRFAAPGRIVGEGRSAGGLLMGAVYNQRPELFAGVIAGVAFVDVINTTSDASLPLTPPEWTEWGNPITSRADFETMLAYSPYDQVSRRAYPPLLAQTALSDSQVTYWEPTKWVAKLRDVAPDAGPYLLHVNTQAGHGGASGRFDQLKEVAEAQAFALWCLGLA